MILVKLARILIPSVALLSGCAAQQKPAVVEKAPPSPPAAAVVTPPPEPVCPPGAPCEGDLNMVIRHTTLHFDFDKDELTPRSQQYLQGLADVLRKYGSAKILISGHCDERGTDEYNIALGHRRASTAAKYLIALGVNPSRVDTVSYGFHRPADNRHNAEAWSMNRRDEFSLKPETGQGISSREEGEK